MGDMTPRRRREPSEPRSDGDWDAGSSREGSPDLVRRPTAQIWLGEIERDRVRHVRDWVHMATRDRDDDTGPPPSPCDHARRDVPRIRGRQARLELVMRMAADRQAELHRLSHSRAVSDFPHRNRIHVRQCFLFVVISIHVLFHYPIDPHCPYLMGMRSSFHRRCSGEGSCGMGVCQGREGCPQLLRGSSVSWGNAILSLV
jgi:hypothetical protein